MKNEVSDVRGSFMFITIRQMENQSLITHVLTHLFDSDKTCFQLIHVTKCLQDHHCVKNKKEKRNK